MAIVIWKQCGMYSFACFINLHDYLRSLTCYDDKAKHFVPALHYTFDGGAMQEEACSFCVVLFFVVDFK